MGEFPPHANLTVMPRFGEDRGSREDQRGHGDEGQPPSCLNGPLCRTNRCGLGVVSNIRKQGREHHRIDEQVSKKPQVRVRHGVRTWERYKHQPQRLDGCDQATKQDVGGKQQRKGKSNEAFVEEGFEVPPTKGEGGAHSRNEEECGQPPLVHHLHDKEDKKWNVAILEQPKREHAKMEPDQQPKQNDSEPIEVVASNWGRGFVDRLWCFRKRRLMDGVHVALSATSAFMLWLRTVLFLLKATAHRWSRQPLRKRREEAG